MTAIGAEAKQQAPMRRWRRGRPGVAQIGCRFKDTGTALLFLGRSYGVYAWSGDHRRQSCAGGRERSRARRSEGDRFGVAQETAVGGAARAGREALVRQRQGDVALAGA
jgi:hypothetical protein